MSLSKQYRTEVLQQVCAFREKHGFSITGFGRWVCNDPNLIRIIETGNPTLERVELTVEKMRTYKGEK